MNDKKPKLFIGSSSESKEIAYSVQYVLRDIAEVVVWDQGVFELNENYLSTLIEALDEYDFAIFIFTGDDEYISKNRTLPAPRDNVIFELGLFMGKLGRKRCFFLKNSSTPIKIPTDLDGISMAQLSMHGGHSNENEIHIACNPIRKKISEHGKITRSRKKYFRSDLLPAVLGKWAGNANQEFTTMGFPINAEVFVEFSSQDSRITGNGVYLFNLPGGRSVEENYLFMGGFFNDRYLRLEYESHDPFRLQFGSVMLELAPNGNELIGRFQGFGVESRTIISGTVLLKRI